MIPGVWSSIVWGFAKLTWVWSDHVTWNWVWHLIWIPLSLHRPPVSPLRTRRKRSFLMPWGICLQRLSTMSPSRVQAPTHLWKKWQTRLWERKMGDLPALPGLPRCPTTSPANLPVPQQSLQDRWCSWPLRHLWTGRTAPPHVLKAPGATLTPMILQRRVQVLFLYFIVRI